MGGIGRFGRMMREHDVTAPAGIWCPVCVAELPLEHVDWRNRQATCPGCDNVILLDGVLAPARPVPALYPARIFAARELAARCLESKRVGEATWLRPSGMLVAIGGKWLIVARDRVEHKARFGRSWTAPLGDVHGVLPHQLVTWNQGQPEVGYRTALLFGPHLAPLFPHGTWTEAASFAAAANAAIDDARMKPLPYR